MFHPMKVHQVTRLTDKAVAIDFEVPEQLKETFSYQAGQYVTLEETIDGQNVRRSYSLCTAPSENRLSVGIKQVPNGVFSTYANQKILAGSVLSVAAPQGRFVLESVKDHTSYTGIAAGSGITPILAIAKEVLFANNSACFYLVYGNKSPKDEMFAEEINNLEAEYASRFKVLRSYSQQTVHDARFGRIDDAVLDELEAISNGKSERYFLCGPEAMIQSMSSGLEKKGIFSDAIQYELFTATVQEENPTVSEGNYTMTLICDEETHTLEGGPGKTLLDVALQNKVDVPYSCQGGVCSSCIARVKTGAAEMALNQILTDGEIEDGLVLTCQAHPTTPKITVDFDDV